MPKKTYLALFYTVEKGLDASHGIYDGVGDTVFSVDIQYDPLAKVTKELILLCISYDNTQDSQ